MNCPPVLKFQIPTELVIKESNFLVIQELRELLHTVFFYERTVSSNFSSIFLNTLFCNMAFISQLITQNNLLLLQ